VGVLLALFALSLTRALHAFRSPR
jgi:hypothetical protein